MFPSMYVCVFVCISKIILSYEIEDSSVAKGSCHLYGLMTRIQYLGFTWWRERMDNLPSKFYMFAEAYACFTPQSPHTPHMHMHKKCN